MWRDYLYALALYITGDQLLLYFPTPTLEDLMGMGTGPTILPVSPYKGLYGPNIH